MFNRNRRLALRRRQQHAYRVQKWHNARKKAMAEAEVDHFQTLARGDQQQRARNTGKALLKAYVICRNYAGGSWRYLTNIMDHYSDVDYILLPSLNSLLAARFEEGDILLIQYTMNTDIPISALSQAIREHRLKAIIPLHDWYWYHNIQTFSTVAVDRTFCHDSYLRSDVTIAQEVKELFSLADVIIAPSKFVSDGYKGVFEDSIPIHTVGHNDYPMGAPALYVPKIEASVINIGMFTQPHPYKGIELVGALATHLKSYGGYRINYSIVGKTIPRYPESGFFDHARTYNIHCFLYLNKWGETYCYALTKALMTGIPIFYNNFGAFKERLGDKEWQFKNIETESAFPDLSGTIARFKICLDYIISKQGTGEFPSNISNTIEYRPFYDKLFDVPTSEDHTTV